MDLENDHPSVVAATTTALLPAAMAAGVLASTGFRAAPEAAGFALLGAVATLVTVAGSADLVQRAFASKVVMVAIFFAALPVLLLCLGVMVMPLAPAGSVELPMVLPAIASLVLSAILLNVGIRTVKPIAPVVVPMPMSQ